MEHGTFAQEGPSVLEYALESLYRDQPRFARDVIPFLLTFLRRHHLGEGALRLRVRAGLLPNSEHQELRMTHDIHALTELDPDLMEDLERWAVDPGVFREQLTEYAGYALAMVAISLLLPGRRVVAFRARGAPDLLLDATPGALCGVEVAARAGVGFGTLVGVARSDSKLPALCRRSDRAELHLSLWSTRIGIHDEVFCRVDGSLPE